MLDTCNFTLEASGISRLAGIYWSVHNNVYDSIRKTLRNNMITRVKLWVRGDFELILWKEMAL